MREVLVHADAPRVTRHAEQRMAQRAIRRLQVQLISSFGVDHLQKGGSVLSFIPDTVIAELRVAIDRCPGVSIVKGKQEQIVTAFHQRRKTRHAGWTA